LRAPSNGTVGYQNCLIPVLIDVVDLGCQESEPVGLPSLDEAGYGSAELVEEITQVRVVIPLAIATEVAERNHSGHGRRRCTHQRSVIRSPPAYRRQHRACPVGCGRGRGQRSTTYAVPVHQPLYVVPMGTHVIAEVGKIVTTEGPQLGNSVIVDI
jgi:hypothetical protein